MDRTRIHLIRILKILTLAGVAALAYILLASLFLNNPSKGRKTVTVNLARLLPGETRIINELSTPVIILHRTPQMIASLKYTENAVQNGSNNNQTTQNNEYFIAYSRFAFINHSSDITGELDIRHKPATHKPTYCSGKTVVWSGGFVDTAGRDICFDYAGRVYNYDDYRWLKQIDNLKFPQYEFTGGGWVKIWVE